MKREKNRVYVSKTGEMIKLFTTALENNLGVKLKSNYPKNKRIEKLQTGKFKGSDLKYVINGLDLIKMLGDIGIDRVIQQLKSKQDLSEDDAKKILYLHLSKKTMLGFVDGLNKNVRSEYVTKREIAQLQDLYDIVRNSRDGVITKESIRIEVDENGNKREIKSEVPMTEQEIIDILGNYRYRLFEIKDREFSEYTGLGLSILNLLGSMYFMQTDEKSKRISKNVGLSAIIEVSALLANKYLYRDYGEKVYKNERNSRNLQYDLAQHERISISEEEKVLDEASGYLKNAKNEKEKITNKSNFINLLSTASIALVLGKSAFNELKNNDKNIATALSKILIDYSISFNMINEITKNINSMFGFSEHKNELKDLEGLLENIVTQIEEKQDPLVEVQGPFNSMEIKDLHGKFYPQKDYETGEKIYGHKLDVPEFHIKRGEVVLLSGKSGRGKSTFIRLLKRGDINNRLSLKIDGKENVDKLGRQFFAIKADRTLGTNTNLLKQLTGKESISELSDKEIQKLEKVLDDVNMRSENILEELASQNYKQFSTGQQKRLVLAQALYKTDNNISVILVDEPVGNVEDSLIDEQLKVISEYARKSGAMTILTTHRVDLAEKYVDRRYHIGDDGVLREVSIDKNKNDGNIVQDEVDL